MKRREFAKILGKTVGGLLIAQFVPGCKNISGPSDPTPRTNDEVELMYARTLPIIYPGGFATEDSIQVTSNTEGGRTVPLSLIGPDQWMGSTVLNYSKTPYYTFVIDTKVTKDFVGVARTISVRIKGQGNWIQLISIEQNPQAGGEWARFFIDKNGIRIQ